VEGFIQPEEAQVSDEEREYLNETIRSLNNQLVDALRERDEARRLVCRYTKKTYRTLREMAEERGWDCFKDNA
jgi:chromosome segregation ATPase